MKTKTLKSLTMSIISTLLCFSCFIGSTFAWFTDQVTSENNIIASGKLDIEMEWADGSFDPADSATIWTDASVGAIFDYDKWEPGYAQARHIKIKNNGSLAFTYQLMIQPTGELGVLAEVIDVYFIDPAQTVNRSSLTQERLVGTLKNVVSGLDASRIGNGNLEAGQECEITIVLKMQESATNEYMNQSIGSSFAIQILANQYAFESDSFGNDYDIGAFPQIADNYSASVSLNGMLNNENKTAQSLTIGNSTDDINAHIPADVKIADGASELVLSVARADRSSNILMSDGQVSRSLDVHIEGVSPTNDVPIIVNLGQVLPTGLKNSSISLYHVENGVAHNMSLVDTFTAHNQFTYNRDTGEVSIYISSFSEITAVVSISNPWDGTVDTTWYNDVDTEFIIDSAEDLAGLGALVSGGNTFEGKTIKLASDLDLGGVGHNYVFYPIGYQYNESDTADTPHAFKGIFDGQGNRISDLYQNTWNIKGHYDNGYYKKSLGLFALIDGGTVKNLVLENFILEGEFAPTGCVAGLGYGGTFENITLRRCQPATYNTGVAGIIGWDAGVNETYTFNNISVGSSNTIHALWGSWDVACGGIMGFLDETSTATMTNCTVAANMDVYNDVCANYQYYQYRYAGMLIGTIGSDGIPESGNLTCTNCNVYIGSWADYYYCEFEKNSSASYTEDFQFSRVDDKDIVFDLSGNAISCTHDHTLNEDKLAYHLPFSQLYTGYSWGATAVYEHDGVNIMKYIYEVIYVDGTHVLNIDYVTDNTTPYNLNAAPDGFSWINGDVEEVTSIPAGNEHSVVVYLNDISTYYARFVDVNGMEIYSEQFKKGATSVKNEPSVPTISGYYGSWEPYDNLLKNATSDVIIRPVYSLEQNSDILSNVTDIGELFDALSQGHTAIMSQSLSGTISSANKSVMSVITNGVTDKDASLTLNSFDLSYDSSSNANKNWTLFQINGDSKLTVSGGLPGYGTLTFNISKLNSNARPTIFDIKYGGTLILERGVTIEIKCADASDISKITTIVGITDLDSTDANGLSVYPGLNIINEGNSIKIIVTGTTTLVGNDSNNT